MIDVSSNIPNIGGRVAWVTGASSGIGKALAYALAARGASLVLSARRAEILRQVQAACPRADEHVVLPLDMLEPASFEPAVRAVLDRFGQVDILVHCAGISQRGRAVETQIHVDRHIMALNYFGPVALTKQVLPAMLARRGADRRDQQPAGQVRRPGSIGVLCIETRTARLL